MREDKVLIVEDNALIAHAIEEASERLQLATDVATDGWDAIEMLRRGQYAGVVIDTAVPHRSGYGVLRWLREENGAALENVIVMTNDRGRFEAELRVIDRGEDVDAIAAAMREALEAAQNRRR